MLKPPVAMTMIDVFQLQRSYKNIFCMQPKLLYRSRTRRYFYGTEYEIQAEFGLAGNTEKKMGPIMSNF